MTYIVSDYQWSPGHRWERFEWTATAAEIRSEFDVDPERVATLILRLPFDMGERILVWKPS